MAAGGHFDIGRFGGNLGVTNDPLDGVPCVAHDGAEMRAHAAWDGAQEALLRAPAISRDLRVLHVWESTYGQSSAHVGKGDCTHYQLPGAPSI